MKNDSKPQKMVCEDCGKHEKLWAMDNKYKYRLVLRCVNCKTKEN